MFYPSCVFISISAVPVVFISDRDRSPVLLVRQNLLFFHTSPRKHAEQDNMVLASSACDAMSGIFQLDTTAHLISVLEAQ